MRQPERSALAEGAAALGIEAGDTQIDTLLAYLQQLQKWNRVYNLTAVRDPMQMVSHHLLDSMAVVRPLRRERPLLASVLDVGSGAGLPGAVISILLPDVRVTCVDAVAKKAAFIRQAAAELGLMRLQAIHSRVEALKQTAPDVIVSRAFASLAGFVSVTRHLMKAEGCWLAMKGAYPTQELTELPNDIEVFHVEQIQVPGLDVARHLVWMRMHALAQG